MYKIYGLITDKDDEIKYIGQTSKELQHRLKQHISSSLKEKEKYTKKENWIRKRIKEGYEIKIIKLEDNLSKHDANIMEISWIEYYGLENLTNLTIGGDGISGKVYNYEERSKWYNSVEIHQYSIDGKFIKTYPTIAICARELNISHSSIWYCMSNKNITSHNYIFVDEKEMLYEKLAKLNNIKYYELYDLYGNLIDVDKSIFNLNKKYNLTQCASEFSKRLNNGIVPQKINEKYFIKFPNFNLDVMLTSLKRYKIINIKSGDIKWFTFGDDIATFLNCSKSLITDCLSKIKKSAKGWQIYHHDDVVEQYSKKGDRKIIEIDDCGNIIKTFNTIKECSEFYNIDSSCISKVCRGKRMHVKHHKFKYINDIV